MLTPLASIASLAPARRLRPRQRECLRLRYLRAQSQREIAARLGIHQTTVSQHIRYALEKLRQIVSLG